MLTTTLGSIALVVGVAAIAGALAAAPGAKAPQHTEIDK